MHACITASQHNLSMVIDLPIGFPINNIISLSMVDMGLATSTPAPAAAVAMNRGMIEQIPAD